MTMQLQNVSVPRGNDATITVDVTASVGDTLAGCTIVWGVYAQMYGVPVDPPTPLFTKSTSAGSITIPGGATPMRFVISLSEEDTAPLSFGNYYHEALVTDTSSNRDTVVGGILTITQSENA